MVPRVQKTQKMSEPRKKLNKGLMDFPNCRCINEAQRSIVSRTWDAAIMSSFAIQEQRDLQVGHCGRTKEECFHASDEKVQACNPHSSGVENSQYLQDAFLSW